MNSTWWRSQDELDPVQRRFVLHPPEGRLMLQGPPGSGKTNLLLLRAQYIAGRGLQNVLVITFTNSLADFMRNGVQARGIIDASQVRTFHSWANEHIAQHLGEALVPQGTKFTDAVRKQAVELLRRSNELIASPKLFDAIFVDEAQDLSTDELDCLLPLSDKICVCGDKRQGLYRRDGLNVAATFGLEEFNLTAHYRIGQRIAQVADRIIPPLPEAPSLEGTCNYNIAEYGASSAIITEYPTRDAQFDAMCSNISLQLDAFKGELIGILCARRRTAQEVWDRLQGTELRDQVCFHLDGGSFNSDKPIHLMTMHAAKGTEFRAIHLFGTEDLTNPYLSSRELAYTAVTRGRTALNAYRTGPTSAAFGAGFAVPGHIPFENLFPGNL